MWLIHFLCAMVYPIMARVIHIKLLKPGRLVFLNSAR